MPWADGTCRSRRPVRPSPRAWGWSASGWRAPRSPICAPSRRPPPNDPYAARETLLRGIDRDVLIVFVESYGRTSLDTPLYAETHRTTLTEAEARLGALGLEMRSGLLSAPTRGGQSWLSHATFANGLWIADQTSYAAALASNRRGLFHIASDAGFRTAAVMPQITLDWPESARMGFETVLAAPDLGYAGLPFNWVTMPDQFTFAALDRLLRDGRDERPLFRATRAWLLARAMGAGARAGVLGRYRRRAHLRRDGAIRRPAGRGLARQGPRPRSVSAGRRLRAQRRVRLRRAPCGRPAADLRGGRSSGRGLRGAGRPPGRAGARDRPPKRWSRPRRAGGGPRD